MSESVHGIFLRLEAYALVAASRKSGGNTLLKVAAEAMRMAGHCDHVKCPVPPSLIYGASPLLLVKEHEARSIKAVSRYFHKPSGTYKTRRQRRDRPVVIAGVISVPYSWDELDHQWPLFKIASIEWLIEYFGAQHLHGVIEHTDERCLHLHFFLSPLEDESIMHIHPGFKAVCALGYCATPRQKRAAFEAAMRGMLDEFHREVGQRFDLVRRHLGAKRMSRQKWHIWNWYRQRAHSQKERLAEKASMGLEHEASIANGQQSCDAIDFRQPMEIDLNFTGPRTQPVNVVDNLNFLVSRKKTRSVAYEVSNLSDVEPTSNYSWVRPRGA